MKLRSAKSISRLGPRKIIAIHNNNPSISRNIFKDSHIQDSQQSKNTLHINSEPLQRFETTERLYNPKSRSPNREVTNTESNLKTQKRNWSQIFNSVSCKTKAGHNGISAKTNQDTYISQQTLFDVEENAVFGVFDGHGQHGHKCSEYIKKNIVEDILNNIKNKENTTGIKLDKEEHVSKVLVDSFHKTDNDMNKKMNSITGLSGSTANLVLILKDMIYCANVGDSRAQILANRQISWELIDMSRDHKPTIPEEKQRILKAGGRIEPSKCNFFS